MLINSSLGRDALDCFWSINRFQRKSKKTYAIRIQERTGMISTAKRFSKLVNLRFKIFCGVPKFDQMKVMLTDDVRNFLRSQLA